MATAGEDCEEYLECPIPDLHVGHMIENPVESLKIHRAAICSCQHE